MSQQSGVIARLMRNGKIDEHDAWWVRGEDWRAAKKEADAWRMKAEANQRYLDEARGHLAVRTSLSVTLGDKVRDLESKLAAANLLVATLREQVTANIWAHHHQLKDDIEEWRSAAASRSAQVRNLEKQLRDEQEEHAEVVGKYSHKVDDLEELLNDERNEYEIVLGEKCSLLGRVESLKETVEELTGKVALLEDKPEWVQSVTHEGHEYKIAHKDYTALTGKDLNKWNKARSSGKYILRDGEPLYYVNPNYKQGGTLNVFIKGVGLKIANGEVVYINCDDEHTIDRGRNWFCGTGSV